MHSVTVARDLSVPRTANQEHSSYHAVLVHQLAPKRSDRFRVRSMEFVGNPRPDDQQAAGGSVSPSLTELASRLLRQARELRPELLSAGGPGRPRVWVEPHHNLAARAARLRPVAQQREGGLPS